MKQHHSDFGGTRQWCKKIGSNPSEAVTTDVVRRLNGSNRDAETTKAVVGREEVIDIPKEGLFRLGHV